MADVQLISLLTEYAQNPARSLEEVAIKLQLSLAHARRLMKKFAYAAASTVNEKDFPRTAALKLGVSEDIILGLEKHIDEYADTKILEELKRRTPRPGTEDYIGDTAMPRESFFDDATSAQALSGSNPTKVLNYILFFLFRKKVDRYIAKSFLDLFAMQEDYFMAQPMILERKMRDHFGNKEGTAIFSEFYDMVQMRLGPNQQFGGPQWQGGGYGGGGGAGGGMMGGPSNIHPTWNNMSGGFVPNAPRNSSFASFYQAKGVIPMGVDPESPEAKRAIDEYEQEKRDRRANEDIANKMKHILNMRMTELMDPKAMGGMGGGAGGLGGPLGGMGIAPYIASGNIRVVIREGANGKPEQVVESMVPGQNGHGPDGDPTTNAITKVYDTLMASNNNMNQMMQPFLQSMIEKAMNGGGGMFGNNPVDMIRGMKEMANTLNPPGQVQQSIDMARLMVAERRIDADREVALKTLEGKRADENAAKGWEHKQEEMSWERQNTLIDTLVNNGLKSFGPIIEAVVAAKLGPKLGGAGGVPGMPNGGVAGVEEGPAPPADGYYGGPPGGQPPGGGMPGRMVGPDDGLRYAGASGGGGYGNSVTEGERAIREAAEREREARDRMDRQQMEQQQAWASVSRAKTYSPEDFQAFSDDQLDAYETEGRSWQASSVNFMDAVRAAKYNRMLQRKRSGETTVPTLSQPIASPGGVPPANQQFDEEEVYIPPANAREIGAPEARPQQTMPGKQVIPDFQKNARQIGEPEPEVPLADMTPEEEQEEQMEYTAQEKEESGEGVYEESEVEVADRGDIA